MGIYYGKTTEEAIENGLKELGIDKEQAEIVVLKEAQKGFLGINAKKAEVEITVKEVKKTDGERATEFLNSLFTYMNVTAKSVLSEEDEKITINLVADNSSALIGYRGEVLDSLQTLAGAVANIGREDYRRVVVDCEGYREKREETLTSLAQKLAAKAVRTGRKVTLEPMNPYERRILHSALSESTEVKTQSEGKEPNRYVAIIPNNLKPYSDKKEGGFKGGRDGYKKGGYNKDKEGGYRKEGGYNRDRNGRDRRSQGGYSQKPARPKTSGFGTFLGNSLKDENKE